MPLDLTDTTHRVNFNPAADFSPVSEGTSYNVTSTSDYNDTAGTNWTSAGDGSKTLVVPAVMFCLGVVGNVIALVILTVRPSRDSKATAFYHLVKALACMDLFGIVASSPVTLIVYVNGGVINTGGMPLCHYFSFILVMAGNATLFTVLVMAVERFMVTKYPFKYSRMVTPVAVNSCVAVVWVGSSLIAILPIVGMGRNVDPWPGTWCFFDYRGTDVSGQIFSYAYAVCGLLAIVLTIILNMIVMQHLWRMRRSRLTSSSLRSSTGSSPLVNKARGHGPDSERRMVIFLMAIIVVFAACYAPLMIRVIMNQLLNTDATKDYGVDNHIDLWALRLASINQILDPWVYIISRVTCCNNPRESHDTSVYARSHTAVVGQEKNDGTKSPTYPDEGKKGRLAITMATVRHFFNKNKLGDKESEAVIIPLTPTQLSV
ncbi:unnamed protein product [Lymnaea stagnalis]|uniref:G-protein coupled receptors family 1 profile domain-containing protein n=1 Tax=Lymnaea stagnalis TaxID=6523 RepID=A0AAV2HWN1_LYMST